MENLQDKNNFFTRMIIRGRFCYFIQEKHYDMHTRYHKTSHSITAYMLAIIKYPCHNLMQEFNLSLKLANYGPKIIF